MKYPTYYTPVNELTKADITKENIKAILLAVAIGVSLAAVGFFQLS